MPKKLDDCVSKVMMKGKDRSSAFAICNASLYKKALSEKGLKKRFDEAYAREASAKSAKEAFDDEYRIRNGGKKIGEVSAFDGHKTNPDEVYSGKILKKRKALERLESIRSNKTDRALSLVRKKKEMNRNLADFGKRKVSSAEKIVLKSKKLFSKVKHGLEGLAHAGGHLAPALAKAVR